VTDPACYRVPLDRYPGMNPFVLDWLKGDERFLSRAAPPPPAAHSLDSGLIDALIASNRRWGLDVAADLRRWAGGETQTIVGGQQVGFGGGPLYTFAKIASLLKLKRDNESRGVATTLFFWLATEDHDFAEVAALAIPNRDEHRQRDLTYLRAPHTDSRAVVGRLPIPDSLATQLTEILGTTRPKWLRPGITFADSFAELIATTFGRGFILVDSLLPELRRAGAPLFDAIVSRWDEVQKSIAARSADLERAGYTPQVVQRPGESYTLLYNINSNGERELIHTPSRITAPESISTSALTRPLLQDFVLQPDIFVGGPAEVAYYAQIAPLHKLLGIRMPRIALRAHELIAPRKIVRYLSRFGIEPQEIFERPEEMVGAHAERGVAEVQRIAMEAEAKLKTEIDKIRELSLPADHAVARAINRSIGHIEYHFRKLTDRAIRGLVRKDRDRFQAARELASTFYPDQHVQDRVVAWLPWWCEYREQLVERMVSEAEPDAATFKIVSL
jgi:bacillithiol biosynthesis cysteine-adding enzyme BshC